MDSDDEPDAVLDAPLDTNTPQNREDAQTKSQGDDDDGGGVLLRAAEWWASLLPKERDVVFEGFFPKWFQDRVSDVEPADLLLQYLTIKQCLHSAIVCNEATDAIGNTNTATNTGSMRAQKGLKDLILVHEQFVFAAMSWAMDGSALGGVDIVTGLNAEETAQQQQQQPSIVQHNEHTNPKAERSTLMRVLEAANATGDDCVCGVFVRPVLFVELWGRLFASLSAAGLVENISREKARELLKVAKEKVAQSEADARQATAFREAGNAQFERRNFDGATKEYTRGIKSNPLDHLLYLNRAASHLRLVETKEAFQDLLCYEILCPPNEPRDRLAKCILRLAQTLTESPISRDKHVASLAPAAHALQLHSLALHASAQALKAVTTSSAGVRRTPPSISPSALRNTSPCAFGTCVFPPIPRTFPRALAESLDPGVLRSSDSPFRIAFANHTDMHTILFTLCDLRYRVMEAEGCPLLTDPENATPELVQQALDRLAKQPSHAEAFVSEPTVDALARDILVLALVSAKPPPQPSVEGALSRLALCVVAMMENFLLTASQREMVGGCLRRLVQASCSKAAFSTAFPWLQLLPLRSRAQQPESQQAKAKDKAKGSKKDKRKQEGGRVAGEETVPEASVLVLLQQVWLRWLRQLKGETDPQQKATNESVVGVLTLEPRDEGMFFLRHGHVRLPNDVRKKYWLLPRNDDEVPEFHNPTMLSAVPRAGTDANKDEDVVQVGRTVVAEAIRSGQVPALGTWFPMWHDATSLVGEMLRVESEDSRVVRLKIKAFVAPSVCDACECLELHGMGNTFDVVSVADGMDHEGVLPILLRADVLLKAQPHATVDAEARALPAAQQKQQNPQLPSGSTAKNKPEEEDTETVTAKLFASELSLDCDAATMFGMFNLTCISSEAGPGQMSLLFQHCTEEDRQALEEYNRSTSGSTAAAKMPRSLLAHMLHAQLSLATTMPSPWPKFTAAGMLDTAHRLLQAAKRAKNDALSRGVLAAVEDARVSFTRHYALSLTTALVHSPQIAHDLQQTPACSDVRWRRWRVVTPTGTPLQTTHDINTAKTIADYAKSGCPEASGVLAVLTHDAQLASAVVGAAGGATSVRDTLQPVFARAATMAQVLLDGVVLVRETSTVEVALPRRWREVFRVGFGMAVPPQDPVSNTNHAQEDDDDDDDDGPVPEPQGDDSDAEAQLREQNAGPKLFMVLVHARTGRVVGKVLAISRFAFKQALVETAEEKENRRVEQLRRRRLMATHPLSEVMTMLEKS